MFIGISVPRAEWTSSVKVKTLDITVDQDGAEVCICALHLTCCHTKHMLPRQLFFWESVPHQRRLPIGGYRCGAESNFCADILRIKPEREIKQNDTRRGERGMWDHVDVKGNKRGGGRGGMRGGGVL